MYITWVFSKQIIIFLKFLPLALEERKSDCDRDFGDGEEVVVVWNFGHIDRTKTENN